MSRTQGICFLASLRSLTVSILEGLLLLARFGDDFNSTRIELSQILPVGVEHFDTQHEVLPLIGVRDEECFRRRIVLPGLQIQLNHVLGRGSAAYAHEGEDLCTTIKNQL